MNKLKVDTEKLIEAYQEGHSMNSLAEAFGIYATTVRRILIKNGIPLRHDRRTAGKLCVKDGEKLIEWAKSQKRLVTKAELAKILGTKKLSPSYFIKYPELGQYIQPRDQKELKYYNTKLYLWLKENNIPFKPNDKTKLKISVDALLLGEYSNIIIQVNIKPRCISKAQHEKNIEKRYHRADKAGVSIIWLKKENFENLDSIKGTLEILKNKEAISC